jgi:hypothetical protein
MGKWENGKRGKGGKGEKGPRRCSEWDRGLIVNESLMPRVRVTRKGTARGESREPPKPPNAPNRGGRSPVDRKGSVQAKRVLLDRKARWIGDSLSTGKSHGPRALVQGPWCENVLGTNHGNPRREWRFSIPSQSLIAPESGIPTEYS